MSPIRRIPLVLLGLAWAMPAHAGRIDLAASAGRPTTAVLVRVASCPADAAPDASSDALESQLGLELTRAGFAPVAGERVARELVASALDAADGLGALRARAQTLGADYVVVGCVATLHDATVVRARIDLMVVRVRGGDLVLRTREEASSARAPAALARDIAIATVARRLWSRVAMTLSDHCAIESPARALPVQSASPFSLGLALPGATITWDDLVRAGDATLALLRGER